MINKTSFLLFSCILLTGCGNSDIYSGDVISGNQARSVRAVTYGTLISVRPVRVQTNENSDGSFGALGGAVLGGVLGNTVGNGSGRALAIATGAVLGGVVGEKAENKLSQANAVELEIKKDDGSTIAVVQTLSTTQFTVGQRVRIVGSGNSLSVSPQ